VCLRKGQHDQVKKGRRHEGYDRALSDYQCCGATRLHVRKRIARAGPEDRLIGAALKTEFFLRRELPAVFFHEPEMPTGQPDVVAVYMSKKEQPELTPDRLRLTAAHIRTLHGLHTVSSTTIEELAYREARSEIVWR
jgi:hypothetical protein